MRYRDMTEKAKKDYHRLASYKTMQKRLEIVQSFRNERGCEECGEKHPAVLDLHHRDPTSKHPRLKVGSRAWRTMRVSDIEAELEKCDVLCSNCHRIRESERRQRQKELV